MIDCRLSFARLAYAAVPVLVISACSGPAAQPSARPATQPAASSPSGSLNVLVRPPDRTIEPIPVSDPGALPVQSSGAMTIDVELDEPAFIYLIWINPEGEILPLYPWNNETLGVKDVGQPPPVRRATKRIFSPLLGRSWTFGSRNGAETVILLSRRTALPDHVHLGGLLTSPPTQKLDNPTDLVSVRLPSPAGKKPSSTTAPDSESSHRALVAFLEPLTKHFDLIEAVQFAHQDKKPD